MKIIFLVFFYSVFSALTAQNNNSKIASFDTAKITCYYKIENDKLIFQ